MLDRGHYFIADDAVLIIEKNNSAYLHQVNKTKGLLHLRKIGIIKVAEHFGKDKIKAQQRLDLIVKLHNNEEQNHTNISPDHEIITLHNKPVHQIKISTHHAINTPLKLETLVKQYKLTAIQPKERKC